MAFIKVCSLAALPPGSVTEVMVGERAVAVCNHEGTVHALDGICPHEGGPVGQGGFHGNMLVCPWHAWEFDCTTGENDFDPDVKLAKFPVEIREGDILVDLG
ncbi:MAG: Rieske (2Fe-2S) protein [Acidobacteria bacterium]|nr:Rieske (2Fe-2S) protein [Acidobacteriota bacterium]